MTKLLPTNRDEFFKSFDGFILDQWGVLFNGSALYGGVLDFFERGRAQDIKTVILSNSGKSAKKNAERLALHGLTPELYDGFMTSGEAVYNHLKDNRPFGLADDHNKIYLISRNNDHSLMDGLDYKIVDDLRKADFVLLSGLDDHYLNENSIEPLLQMLIAHKKPMICANPDMRAVHAGGKLTIGAGYLAHQYKDHGGDVLFFGKPHRPIFEHCLDRFGMRGCNNILMVGDSLHHDILGGQKMGFQTLLIGHGLLARKAGLLDVGDAPSEMAQLEALRPIFEAEKIKPDFYAQKL